MNLSKYQMTESDLRGAVMDEMDAAYERSNGSAPDHIIVSRGVWSDMVEHRRFERLKDENKDREGFLGMKVWPSAALDHRHKTALLLSDEAFRQMFPHTEDRKAYK